jgi:hypothetical protein
VPEAGLEPAQNQVPRDFKSVNSLILLAWKNAPVKDFKELSEMAYW